MRISDWSSDVCSSDLYDRHRNMAVRAVLGTKIDRVMRRATVVLAGNNYLAERARSAGCTRVEWLPTVVDADRYSSTGKSKRSDGPLTVGWIGRSDERSRGKECASKCRTRWAPS